MKNANSRFVRVLAIALVVLMVVPAALVGCGSNKANNAAISEALAAAEAARKEAEEAKAAADAAAAEAAAKAAAEAQKALEEANKKAEEAIKAAEEAKKKAEEAEKQAAEAAKTTAAPTTTAPVTTAPTEDMKVVSDYAYKMLNDHKLDFLKAYYTYAYGATEEELKKDTYVPSYINNIKYTADDVEDMHELYGAARVAIYQANTVDYINQIVANFVATISATPTYVERVVDAYEAIDFDSDYDVLDVVYAYNLIALALTEMDPKNDVPAIKAYGENEINLVKAVYTEYYRYTGNDDVDGDYVDKADFEDEDILYAEMYTAATNEDGTDKDVIDYVYILFNNPGEGKELDVTQLVYFEDIEDALKDVEDAYAKWNNKYFVKEENAELIAAYEQFRQAFVGEDYILDYTNDHAWEAVVASGTRVGQLLAAAEEAKSFAKLIKAIANLEMDPAATGYFKYDKQISKVEEAKAALDAWKAKYDFKDVVVAGETVENPNIIAILGSDYVGYKANALVVEYFAYLEKTASAVNVDAFIDAAEEELNDVLYNFDFKKYGSAVGAALDWFFGKEKRVPGSTTLQRKDGFLDLKAREQLGFKELGSDDAKIPVEGGTPIDNYDYHENYNVLNLIADGNANIKAIFDKLFDIDITKDLDETTTDKTETIFDKMLASYNLLLAKKKSADEINDDIEEALELGVDAKALASFAKLFVAKQGESFKDFDEADDDEKKDHIVGGAIYSWANSKVDTANSPIEIGDENFMNLIDWDSLATVYANSRESLSKVISDSAEVVLEYIAWQAAINGEATYNEEDEEITFTYEGKPYKFSDLKPEQIDIYSYARIKNVIELEKTLEDLFDADDEAIVTTLKNLTAEVEDDDESLNVALTAVIDYCADMIKALHDARYPVQVALADVQDKYPLLNKGNVNDWKDKTGITGDMVLEYAMYGRLGDGYSNGADYKAIRDAVYAVLNASTTYKFKSVVGYGTSNGTTGSGVVLYPTSYQGAIYSVDPLKYAVRNADDKITGFDSAAYKAALNTAISSVYTKFLAEYVKDVNQASDFDTIVTKLTTAFYNAGIWNVEDEIVIGDETYTYAIVSTGLAADLVVYDSSDEKITSENLIKFKYDTVEYTVTLTVTPDFVNGKFAITPAVDKSIPDAKKDVYDLLGVKAEDLVYDIRNYTDVIGANFEKIGTFKPLGDSSNYRNTTKAELDTIFGYEVKNDFYATFEYLRNKMYTKSTSSSNWNGLGTYIDSGVATGAASDAIKTLSRMARDEVFAMTADANSIKDIEKAFNNFATRVKAVLAQNGITEYDATNNPTGTYKVEKDAKGYEKLVPVTTGPQA